VSLNPLSDRKDPPPLQQSSPSLLSFFLRVTGGGGVDVVSVIGLSTQILKDATPLESDVAAFMGDENEERAAADGGDKRAAEATEEKTTSPTDERPHEETMRRHHALQQTLPSFIRLHQARYLCTNGIQNCGKCWI
jgi:hypothetical protein